MKLLLNVSKIFLFVSLWSLKHENTFGTASATVFCPAHDQLSDVLNLHKANWEDLASVLVENTNKHYQIPSIFMSILSPFYCEVIWLSRKLNIPATSSDTDHQGRYKLVPDIVNVYTAAVKIVLAANDPFNKIFQGSNAIKECSHTFEIFLEKSLLYEMESTIFVNFCSKLLSARNYFSPKIVTSGETTRENSYIVLPKKNPRPLTAKDDLRSAKRQKRI